MDIIDFISSLNKISLVAFFITGGFVIYELSLFKKEISINKTKPNIPDFKGETGGINYAKVIVNEKKRLAIKKGSIAPLVISIIVFIFLGITLVFNFINFQNAKLSKSPITPTPAINLIASSGIKIYNQNWIELTDTQLERMRSGDNIYIGIEMVPDPNIDKARIRVNKEYWTEEDITVRFNKEKKVFYREYVIGTDEAFLKIEAQFHSKVDGWLGE